MDLDASWQVAAVVAAIVGFSLALPQVSDAGAIRVADFEAGVNAWNTNDTGRATGKTKEATHISIASSDEAHSGKRSLQITFQPGDPGASCWMYVTEECDRWACARVDEISFWMKRDASDGQVVIRLLQWADNLTEMVFFHAPVPTDGKSGRWQRVVLPLEKFQESNKDHPLRLPSLWSVQIELSGASQPAVIWIDDIEVRNARGAGDRFAAGPLDEQIAKCKPVNGLPRFGNWAWPGRDQKALEKLVALGIQFSSNREAEPWQQRNYLAGIATNLHPGRPSGAELISGLGLTDEDLDQDSQGKRMGDGVESAVFHEAVPERFAKYVREHVRPIRNAPWVSSIMLGSPVSMYGEVHYSGSTAGQYAVFGRAAKQNFQRWLKKAYQNDLQALSKAWGEPLKSWEEIVPPDGQKASHGSIDTTRKWSDFIHWYNWWLDEISWRSLKAVRRETDKPVALMVGGMKVGPSQGITLGNVGPIIRMLGKVKPAFFNDTDAQTLFSTRYTRAACSQYGVEQMQEHVGPPYLQPAHHYNMALNILSCGADHAHLAYLNELLDPDHWFSKTWKNLAPLVLRYRTEYRKSDAAIFHSYMTSWYRPNRSNTDAVYLYDSVNTLWSPESGYPSWGRALASPDVIDDAMIEDGALKDRKLLVIPNSSVTITSRKAVEAIRKWIKSGGTLIGFGTGCLSYTVEADRSVSATPGMAGMLPLLDKEGVGGRSKGLLPADAKVEYMLGKGRVVLYLTPADPNINDSSENRFVDEMIPALYTEADRAGVRRWCRAECGVGRPSHNEDEVNLLYCGKDLNSGKHLFTADFTQSVRAGQPTFFSDRTFQFTFDESLTGDAELVGFTDSFESCDGGTAEYDANSHVLIIHFKLPVSLDMKFGKAKTAGPSF